MRENTAKENDGQNKKNKDINEDNKESLKEQGKKENIKYFFNRNRNFFF